MKLLDNLWHSAVNLKTVKSEEYKAGFHAYLFPRDPVTVSIDDPDYQAGWHDAKALDNASRNKPLLRIMLTEDGLIDMFIVGRDGIPIARISHPTQTGEEAEILARHWIAQQEAEQEKGRDA